MRSVFVTFASWFALLVAPVFSLIRDRKTPERIGTDHPEWFERCLMKIFPYRNISKNIGGGGGFPVVKGLYLRRFFLTPRSWPVRVFLHHIVRSDDDRDPHDHPWDFSSSILKGAYLENIDVAPDGDGPADTRVMHAGLTSDNPAEHVHRVDVLEPVWSLVVTERARREWGFTTPNGWVNHNDYLGTPMAPAAPEDRIPGARSF